MARLSFKLDVESKLVHLCTVVDFHDSLEIEDHYRDKTVSD
jgi:hypothetical protein